MCVTISVCVCVCVYIYLMSNQVSTEQLSSNSDASSSDDTDVDSYTPVDKRVPEEMKLNVLCLFCSSTYPSATSTWDHIRTVHKYDFSSTRSSLGMHPNL